MSLLKIREYLFVILLLAFSPFGALNAQEDSGAQDAADAPVSSPFLAELENKDVDNQTFVLLPLTAAELKTLAEAWQDKLKADITAASTINFDLKSASGDAADKLRTELHTATDTLGTTLVKYDAIIDSWKDKGGNPDEIKLHTDYLAAVSVGALRTADTTTIVKRAGDWLVSRDGGLHVLLLIISAIVAFFVLRFIARFIQRYAARKLNLVPSVSHLLRSFISTVVYWVVVFVGFLIVLGFFGVNVTPLFAIFGGLSFILAFALQDTLGNFASGLMIMFLKPFDTGDYIITSGAEGTVDDVSIVSTRLRTVDNKIVVLPNSKIWGDVITNVTAAATRRVDMVFGIGYSDDAQKAIDLLHKLVKEHSLSLNDPKPDIFVGELGDSSVNIFCRVWAKTDDYWTLHWDLMGQAKEVFDAEGISIPFPQRDIHIISE